MLAVALRVGAMGKGVRQTVRKWERYSADCEKETEVCVRTARVSNPCAIHSVCNERVTRHETFAK